MKPINIKLDPGQLLYVSRSIPPEYTGTAMMLLALLYRKNYDGVKLLAPTSHPVMNELIDRGWVRLDNGFTPMLTEEGAALAKTIIARSPARKELSQRAKEVHLWIKDWIALWPRIHHPGSKKLLATDEKNITAKMIWFVDNYEFTVQEIKAATIAYLKDRYRHNWEYVRQATYFIYREDTAKIRTSDLASWCEAVKNSHYCEEYSQTMLTKHAN